MRDEIASINERIVTAAAGKGVQTATTLSALLIAGRQYYIVHAGDSRIYAVGREGLTLLTVDTVGESGKLTSYIGKRGAPELYYTEGNAVHDTFVLCSDGLYKRTGDEWIWGSIDAGTRKTIRRSLNTLAGLAIGQGELDNISIAIIKIAQ